MVIFPKNKIMTKLKQLFFLGFFTLSLGACSSDDTYQNVDDDLNSVLTEKINELYGSVSPLILPEDVDLVSIPSDPNNPLTVSKIILGRLLFHETGIGTDPMQPQGMKTYSCASCHHVDAGFQSGLRQGIGDGGVGFGFAGEGRVPSALYLPAELDVQPIRTPSALNSAFQKVMLWNGQFGAKGPNEGTEAQWTVDTPKEVNNLGFEGLETQAIAGLGVHRLVINADEIIGSPYQILFDDAFSDVPLSDRYTKINAGLAIAAYERTLLSTEAPFQRWLKGDDSAMTENQKEGALLFFGKAQCFQCHSGPALNDMKFHALGMNDLKGPEIVTEVDDATKKGRGGFTANPDDNYKFKTPQLYNLKDVTFYGHGGTFESVKSIIEYKNNAISENNEVPDEQLSDKFIPLNLTDSDINLLTLFLEEALYDSGLRRFIPDSLPTGNCFPNADTQSSSDLGCD